MTAEPIGRRERKKQLTRRAISDVATDLFLARGFDAVTVVEVAAAADVAVQTVFNHFPTKEDLFFDETGWWTGPAQAIRETPARVDVIETLKQHYLGEIRERLASGHLATWRQFSNTIEASPALQARRRRNAEEMEELLVEALRERDDRLSGRMARLIAAQYAAAQKVLEGELARFIAPDATPPQLGEANAELEQAIDEVFAVLAGGLAQER
jgi:AcrR family transcriptional regulator